MERETCLLFERWFFAHFSRHKNYAMMTILSRSHSLHLRICCILCTYLEMFSNVSWYIFFCRILWRRTILIVGYTHFCVFFLHVRMLHMLHYIILLLWLLQKMFVYSTDYCVWQLLFFDFIFFFRVERYTEIA